MIRFGALLTLSACAGAGDGAGFRVVETVPADGAENAASVLEPRMVLSTAADPLSCGPESLLLLAINDDLTIAFEPETTLTWSAEGDEVVFVHSQPLPAGRSYALMVDTLGAPCLDGYGRALEPWLSTFFVP